MADSTGAEGGTAFAFDANPPTEANYKAPDSNIVQNVDVTKVATKGDGPGANDRDYDDPYPGGPTNAPLLPTT